MTLKWVFGATLYVAVLTGGVALGRYLPEYLVATDQPSLMLSAMILAVVGFYVVGSAIPFVPGAEIGFGLIVAFGAKVAVLVYLCMVIALWLAFCVGLLVPARRLQRLFRALRLRKACVLVRKTREMSPKERSAYMMAHAPGRLLPFMLKHRYLSLVLILNLPGNVILGGGGGLALMAGLSRIYSPLGFGVATAVAVAPIPILVVLFGYQP